MKKYMIGIGISITLIIFIVGFVIYSKSNMTLWGVNITKKECKRVIVNTTDDVYLITDSKAVLEILKELDNMVNINKIEDSNWSPKEMTTPEKYTKVKIQTRDSSIYGGKLWLDGEKLLMEADEYLWSVDKDLLELLDKSLVGVKSMVE